MVHLFARLLEVFEAGMIPGVLHRDRHHPLGDQAGEAFAEGHAQGADASRVEAEGRGQDQVGSIRLEQIGGTDIGPEPGGDQGDYVHEGVGGFAPLFGEARDFFQAEHTTGVCGFI